MAGRRDDGGARPERAAEGDAGDRFPRQRLARPVCAVCGRVPTAACAPVVSGIIDRRSTANNTSADDRAALVPHRIEGNAEISSDDPIFKNLRVLVATGGAFFTYPVAGRGRFSPNDVSSRGRPLVDHRRPGGYRPRPTGSRRASKPTAGQRSGVARTTCSNSTMHVLHCANARWALTQQHEAHETPN